MRRLFLITLMIALPYIYGEACTTAIISGKYTTDGRPMMWKVRDSDYAKNSMIYFADGKYSYVGLINSEDNAGAQIWGGANVAGFSIMNSASFNVNLDDETSKKDLEGQFMRKALQRCATLSEFEALLAAEPKPMGLAAHFGVIDAKGGAAFYEVNNNTFTKFDANNPVEAPNGYIIRTNFSFTGKKDVGYGFVRFQTAQDLFYAADAQHKMNYQTILHEFTRCFKNPVLNRDYRKEFSAIPAGDYFVNSDDLISRSGTSSAILVQGVKEGEPADLSTIWTMVGFPNTCVALPLWVREGDKLPRMVLRNKSGNAPLNSMALELMDQCYPMKRSDGARYLQISKLFNLEKTGIVQKLEVVERDIFKAADEKVAAWRSGKCAPGDIAQFYTWLDTLVAKTYLNEFGIKEN